LASNSKATATKRLRERAKVEKAKNKLERREARKEDKEANPRHEGSADPDLEGIIPGPQPLPY